MEHPRLGVLFGQPGLEGLVAFGALPSGAGGPRLRAGDQPRPAGFELGLRLAPKNPDTNARYAWSGIFKMKGGTVNLEHTEILDTPPPIGRRLLVQTQAGDGQVVLTWDDPYPDDYSISGWEYQVNSGGPDDWGSWTEFPRSTRLTREGTVPNLEHETQHKFRVRSTNSTGTGPGTIPVKSP